MKTHVKLKLDLGKHAYKDLTIFNIK
jgi:hypothetical protein